VIHHRVYYKIEITPRKKIGIENMYKTTGMLKNNNPRHKIINIIEHIKSI
jgi:hypothetical protein